MAIMRLQTYTKLILLGDKLIRANKEYPGPGLTEGTRLVTHDLK